MTVTKRLRLGEILTRAGIITEEQLHLALDRQQLSREPIGEILVQLGFVSTGQLTSALELQYGVRSVSLAAAASLDLVRLLPASEIRRLRAVPVGIGQLTVAMVDPANVTALEDLKARFKGVSIQPVVVPDGEFEEFLAILDDSPVPSASVEKNVTRHAPVSPEQALLESALERRASEIVLEAHETLTRVKLRIDGRWQEDRPLANGDRLHLDERLRLLAGIRADALDEPQSGSFRFLYRGRQVRGSYHGLPGLHGSIATVRLYDPERYGQATLAGLISSPEIAGTLSRLLDLAGGLVLFTGPAHPVKTAILYACLRYLAGQGRAVISLESNLELDVAEIGQIQTGQVRGTTAREWLSAALDQAVDAIAVWDLDEPATAREALRAALGGRLLLGGWNTVEPSLADASATWELLPTALARGLAGFVDVRTVRALCPHCRVSRPIPSDVHPLVLQYSANAHLAEPVGCPECDGTGYRDQVGVVEVVPLDAEARQLAAAGASHEALVRRAESQGVMTLPHHAAFLVASGQTSWAEVAALGIFEG